MPVSLVLTISANPLGMLTAFGAGIVSFISPCCLPLVPGYLGMITGIETPNLTSGNAQLKRVLRTTLLFIAGFTLVFVLLGAAASSLGGLLVSHRRVLDIVAGVLIVGVALLIVTGIMPGVLSMERRIHISPSRFGSIAPPIMGMAFAFGWTPCIGPVLGAVLSIAALKATLPGGMALLCVYSLGLGVPFILAGVAWGRASTIFTWLKSHYRSVSIGSGIVLGGWGVLLILGDTTLVASWFSQIMNDLHLSRLTVS